MGALSPTGAWAKMCSSAPPTSRRSIMNCTQRQNWLRRWPRMSVYLRLQADAKWYDTSEEDIRTWFRQLAPDGYERNKRNAEHTIKKLQLLVSLIEEAQSRE